MGTLAVLGLVLLSGAVANGSTAAPVTPDRALAAQDDSVYGCVICHADKRRSFTLGVHSERGIKCHDCHGGDTAVYETPAAHQGRFVGTPSKLGTIQLCSACHADPNQMRQYGLAADQLAEFRTSRHGQLLLERDDLRYWPTHGPPVDDPMPFVQAFLEHRRGRETQILRCLERGLATIDEMVSVMYADVPKILHPAAARSVAVVCAAVAAAVGAMLGANIDLPRRCCALRCLFLHAFILRFHPSIALRHCRF